MLNIILNNIKTYLPLPGLIKSGDSLTNINLYKGSYGFPVAVSNNCNHD